MGENVVLRKNLINRTWFPLAVATIGYVFPLVVLYDLWETPPGMGVRPMGLPLAFLVFGAGTPACVIVMAVIGAMRMYREPRGKHGRSMDPIKTVALVAACLLSLLPMALTTVGVWWVVRSHHLWIEP